MPSPALVSALDRLDQALSHAEALVTEDKGARSTTSTVKDDAIRTTIAELDALIATLGGDTDG